MKAAIPVLLLLGVSSLLAGDDQTPQDRDRVQLRATEAKIDGLIGAAACQADNECRPVPFGAKPCGGPWKYKVYSTRTPDTAGLLKQVEAYRALNAELNRKNRWTSDCSVVDEPVVACLQGRCVPKPPAR